MEAAEEPEAALAKLDNYLCELKEMQIRNGLHILGEPPTDSLRDDLTVGSSDYLYHQEFHYHHHQYQILQWQFD